MKRVLFVSHSPDLYGAERSLLLLLEGARELEIDPVLLTPGEGLLEVRASGLGIPVRRLSRAAVTRARPLLSRAAYFPRLRALLSEVHPDIVYINTSAHAAPLFAARSLGLRTILHVRESESYFRYRRLLGRARIHALVRFPDRFVAVSNATATMLCESGVARDRVTVVHNGVDADSFRPDADRRRSARESLGLAEDDLLVGFLGQLIPRKGGDIFLQAARLVRESHPASRFLIVGGPAGSEHHRALVNLARELGLERHLMFKEFQEDVRPFYDAMELFVSCSRSEPFARVNLEAMAMATPVVATDVGGNREAIADGECGYIVEPENPARLAAKIAALLADAGLRRAFGEAARRRVTDNFTIARYRAGVGAVIDDLLRDER